MRSSSPLRPRRIRGSRSRCWWRTPVSERARPHPSRARCSTTICSASESTSRWKRRTRPPGAPTSRRDPLPPSASPPTRRRRPLPRRRRTRPMIRRLLERLTAKIDGPLFALVACVLMLARYFHRHEAALRLREYVVAFALLAVPTAMIARQPDLGTALLVAAAGFYVIFLAGLSWKVIAGGSAVVLASLPVLWGVLHD